MADITVRGAGKSDLKAAAELSKKVFGSNFFAENYMKEPWFRPSNIRLLFDGNRMASMACVLPRIMNLGGLRVRLGGIGGVATDPAFRGRGHAAAVMRDAVTYMKKNRYALSLLYPYKKEFYAQFGYHALAFPFKVIRVRDIPKPQPCRFTVQKMNRPDYIALNRIYRAYSRRITGTIDRPLSYWKSNCEYWVKQVKRLCWKENPFFCAYEKGRMTAYMRVESIRRDWGDKTYRLKISETGCLPGCEDALSCLAHEAGKYAAASGFDRLFIEHAAAGAFSFAARPTAAEARQYVNLKNEKMYKIIDGPAFFNAANRLLSGRLRPVRATLTKRGENHYALCLNGRQIHLLENGNLIMMLLGLKSSQDPVLSMAFPSIKSVYWDFDYL